MLWDKYKNGLSASKNELFCSVQCQLVRPCFAQRKVLVTDSFKWSLNK